MSSRSIIESLEGRQLLSAKIGISANGASITSGDTSPAHADFTDFGPVALSGTASAVTRSYTVKNTGTGTLTFTGKRQTITGADAKEFTITKGLPTSLAKGKTATITVTFNATSTGTQHAHLNVTSSASTSKTFGFDVKGSGLKTSNVGTKGLQVAVTHAGSGTAAKKGQILTMNYTGYLLSGTQFDTSIGKTPFSFTSEIGRVIPGWQQGLAGTKVGDKRTLFIPSSLAYGDAGQGSIPGKATLVFEVETLAIGNPSLKITGNATTIADGDTTPSTADSTDFGSVKKGQTVTKTFTIATDLFEAQISGISFKDQKTPVHVTGSNAKDFTIGTLTGSADGSTVSFTVTFKPSSTGTRSASLELTYAGNSTDSTGTTPVVVYTGPTTTYNFSIQGKGT